MIQIKVTDILEKKERNIKWLADKCGIGYSTIYNFCMGKTNAVSYNVLEKICVVLECDISDVIEIVRN